MSKMRENFQEGDPITWLQVHNLMPLLVMVVTVASAFYILQGKVDLLNQKLEQMTDSSKAQQSTIMTLQDALHSSQLDIKALETEKQDVKGVATSRFQDQTVTPTPKK